MSTFSAYSQEKCNNQDGQLKGYSCSLQPCSKHIAPARNTASDRRSWTYTSSSPPKPARRNASSERARPLKIDSCSSLPPFPRAGRTGVVALQFRTPHSRKFGKRHPPRVLTLDRSFAMGNRETHYDGRTTLDAPPNLFKQTFPTRRARDKIRFPGAEG